MGKVEPTISLENLVCYEQTSPFHLTEEQQLKGALIELQIRGEKRNPRKEKRKGIRASRVSLIVLTSLTGSELHDYHLKRTISRNLTRPVRSRLISSPVKIVGRAGRVNRSCYVGALLHGIVRGLAQERNRLQAIRMYSPSQFFDGTYTRKLGALQEA